MFKTSVLYEIDKDDSIGATNIMGKHPLQGNMYHMVGEFGRELSLAD